MVRLRPGDAAAAYKSYLRRMSDMLDDTDYLLGAYPTVADFACYHPLWFTRKRTPSMAGILQLTPAVGDWMDRMAAIGHGTMETFDAAAGHRGGGRLDAAHAAVRQHLPGRARHPAGHARHDRRRELRPRADRRRADRRDPHALHAAPHDAARRHGARALPAHRLRLRKVEAEREAGDAEVAEVTQKSRSHPEFRLRLLPQTRTRNDPGLQGHHRRSHRRRLRLRPRMRAHRRGARHEPRAGRRAAGCARQGARPRWRRPARRCWRARSTWPTRRQMEALAQRREGALRRAALRLQQRRRRRRRAGLGEHRRRLGMGARRRPAGA